MEFYFSMVVLYYKISYTLAYDFHFNEMQNILGYKEYKRYEQRNGFFAICYG